jgi:hypothetical protein
MYGARNPSVLSTSCPTTNCDWSILMPAFPALLLLGFYALPGAGSNRDFAG